MPPPPEPASPHGAASPRGSREARRRFWSRMLIAHVVAYPLGFAVTVATIPVAIAWQGAHLATAEGDGAAFGRWLAQEVGLAADEARVAALILGPSLVAALGLLFWVHLWAVPWARAPVPRQDDGDPATRRFVLGVAVPLALWVVVGLVGWGWLLAR